MTSPTIQTYSSAQDYLDALEPHLVPQREWQCHLLLGLNKARALGPTDSRDRFAAIWMNNRPQIAIFGMYSKPTMLHLTACREVYDMSHFQEQLNLVLDYMLSDAQATLLSDTDSISGPADILRPLAALISSLPYALSFESIKMELVRTIRGSYINAQSLLHFPPKAHLTSHTIRQAKPGDDVEAIARIVMSFILEPPLLRNPISMDQLRRDVFNRLENGSYYIYLLEDGQTIAAVGQRHRSTDSGIALTMIVTAEEYRRQGIGSALTTHLIEDALRSENEGGLGKDHVAIFWVEGGPAESLYKKLGFVEGYQRLDYKLQIYI